MTRKNEDVSGITSQRTDPLPDGDQPTKRIWFFNNKFCTYMCYPAAMFDLLRACNNFQQQQKNTQRTPSTSSFKI
jgi:hypothetical protein